MKLDVLDHGDALPALVRRCQEAGARVLAEKVETPAQLALCRDLGVELLPGLPAAAARGAARPVAVARPVGLPAARPRARPAGGVDGRGREAGREGRGPRLPAAPRRELRRGGPLAPGHGLSQALLVLGFAQLRRWALLLLVADLPDEAAAGVEAALLRAGMCEQLAGRSTAPTPTRRSSSAWCRASADLLGAPLPSCCACCPCRRPREAALLAHRGPLGEVLSCVLAYERGRPRVPDGSDLPAAAPREVFLSALGDATVQRDAMTPALAASG